MSAATEVKSTTGPDHYLLFGGERKPGGPLHACPGYQMALGVMLGFFGAVLEQGPVRSLGESSTTLVVSRP